jgi:acyl-CoA thioester hydrolase
MVDINYFADRMKQAKDADQPAGKPVEGPSAGPLVTYRGIVYPWHVDHMDHMNVQHYTGVFDQSSWVLLAVLGLDAQYSRANRRGMATLEQTITYKSELRTGETFEIRSKILEVRERTMRTVDQVAARVLVQHDMHKTAGGELAASTTILGVHLDSEARKSSPFPPDVLERAHALIVCGEDGMPERVTPCDDRSVFSFVGGISHDKNNIDDRLSRQVATKSCCPQLQTSSRCSRENSPGRTAAQFSSLDPYGAANLHREKGYIARLERLGTPILTQVAAMSLTDLFGLYDAHVINGRHYALQTRWVADLTPEIISAVVAAGRCTNITVFVHCLVPFPWCRHTNRFLMPQRLPCVEITS